MSEPITSSAGAGAAGAGPQAAPGAGSAAQQHRQGIREFGAARYAELSRSRRRNAYFHRYLTRIVANHVLPGARVLDVGCAGGDMLAALRPAHGVGIDINPAAIADARARHPGLTFHEMAAEDLANPANPLAAEAHDGFDYIILSGVLPQLYDLHTALESLRPLCHDRTRLIICTFSRLWQPLIRLGEWTGLKYRVPDESWMPSQEVRNLVAQCDFAPVRQVNAILSPLGVPGASGFINRWIAPLPGINQLCLCTVTIARMLPRANRFAPPASVSIVIPARNEAGNIRPLLDRIPPMAPRQEVIFVEGNSTDDTWAAIEKTVAEYRAQHGPDAPQQVIACRQTGRGKGDAVRLGFAKATGEILIILDADISVEPEELPRFVNLLARGTCEFANGSRLVYPMEKRAMRFLNMLANKLFGWMFTYLLGQPLRDTLCGTKVLRRTDYLRIAEHRAYFGDFDPFGDFDLLFGAARLNLKIMDVPVHYKQRVYGETNISRFRHGLLLFRMCAFAARKIKFM